MKPKTLNCQTVNLNELLHSVIRELNTERIKVNWELLAELPEVELDQTQMKHAIINLINNAVEAMPNGGILNIKTASEQQSVIIEISDTGSGIKPEELEKVLQPFYSTKRRGHGLGLSIVYQIIKKHGGDIKVESEAGKRTRVMVMLPVKEKK